MSYQPVVQSLTTQNMVGCKQQLDSPCAPPAFGGGRGRARRFSLPSAHYEDGAGYDASLVSEPPSLVRLPY